MATSHSIKYGTNGWYKIINDETGCVVEKQRGWDAADLRRRILSSDEPVVVQWHDNLKDGSRRFTRWDVARYSDGLYRSSAFPNRAFDGVLDIWQAFQNNGYQPDLRSDEDVEGQCEQAFDKFVSDHPSFAKYLHRAISSELFAQLGSKSFDVDVNVITCRIISEISESFSLNQMELKQAR